MAGCRIPDGRAVPLKVSRHLHAFNCSLRFRTSVQGPGVRCYEHTQSAQQMASFLDFKGLTPPAHCIVRYNVCPPTPRDPYRTVELFIDSMFLPRKMTTNTVILLSVTTITNRSTKALQQSGTRRYKTKCFNSSRSSLHDRVLTLTTNPRAHFIDSANYLRKFRT